MLLAGWSWRSKGNPRDFCIFCHWISFYYRLERRGFLLCVTPFPSLHLEEKKSHSVCGRYFFGVFSSLSFILFLPPTKIALLR